MLDRRVSGRSPRFEGAPSQGPAPRGPDPAPFRARGKRLPIVLACIVLALLLVGPGAAYFWIRWDSAWLKPDDAWTVIAVRFDGLDGQSWEFRRGVAAALFAGTTPALTKVRIRVGSQTWPRRYGWAQICIPWKPLSEMKELLPEYLLSVECELAKFGAHPAYRVAIVDPRGAAMRAQ
jgi:hypothetical protein